jgi:porphobilinogen synthase
MSFPYARPRRLRRSAGLRAILSETTLEPRHLIYPLFIADKVTDQPIPVESMPGVYQHSVESMLEDVEEAFSLGIRGVMLFGVPDEKSPEATSAYDDNGIIQRGIKALKDRFGDDLTVFADTCLCEYTHHGHCGIVMGGQVLNDPSAELLGKVAVSQATAGADVVAPSAMMDGQVAYIREMLDEAGYEHVPILAYSAKYASNLYAPFRDAAESSPSFGNRATYQMDWHNRREALREVALDMVECADMIMVKPSLFYLDILRDIREQVDAPLFAYSVSGEYSMIKAAGNNGWLDEPLVVMEYLTSIRRAGADAILTYAAKDAARWLREEALAAMGLLTIANEDDIAGLLPVSDDPEEGDDGLTDGDND